MQIESLWLSYKGGGESLPSINKPVSWGKAEIPAAAVLQTLQTPLPLLLSMFYFLCEPPMWRRVSGPSLPSGISPLSPVPMLLPQYYIDNKSSN